jgi:hypothetical protein
MKESMIFCCNVMLAVLRSGVMVGASPDELGCPMATSSGSLPRSIAAAGRLWALLPPPKASIAGNHRMAD